MTSRPIRPGDTVVFQPHPERITPVNQYWQPRIGQEFVVVEVNGDHILMWEPSSSGMGEAITCRTEDVTQTPNPLVDLRDRLFKADRDIKAMAEASNTYADEARLVGKAEGVRLAMSYLDETLRGL